MIDWNASAELNNCNVEWLKVWFGRFPKSAKKVVRICDICSDEKDIRFYAYRNLCHTCSHGTDVARKAKSDAGIKRCSDPEEIKVMSEREIKRCSDPEVREVMSERTIKQFSDPEARKDHSDRIKNSDAAHSAQDKQRGGNDLVDHHYIYDHDDLSKNTAQMTRSDHMRLHRLLQKLKYIVPHINIGE